MTRRKYGGQFELPPVGGPLARSRRPGGEGESQAQAPPTPILAQWDDDAEKTWPDDSVPDTEADDYEDAQQLSWPRPAWGFVCLALAVACWVISPRGFLASRFFSQVFLWAAAACLILGLIILAGRWWSGHPEIVETGPDSSNHESTR